ncbi:hypothetical protein RAYM_07909 [Riemerella anatipestifer RA-YM]|nr:hypothetical protein RAYM_07909 [Riemerella anatipestifer RA-YM]
MYYIFKNNSTNLANSKEKSEDKFDYFYGFRGG